MKKWILILLAVCFSGCVSLSVEETLINPNTSMQRRLLTNINKIEEGMSYQEVKSILGDKIRIGYELKSAPGQAFNAITIKSPYRLEIFEDNQRSYQIAYFITHIQKADGIITEDELIPLIFENNKLVGKGADDLFELKNP